ncbi:MAG: hypothetical protein AAFZ15_00495 [Bacteroidota bacterium]
MSKHGGCFHTMLAGIGIHLAPLSGKRYRRCKAASGTSGILKEKRPGADFY